MRRAVAEKGSLFTPVLIVGCIIVLVGFAIRASFGVFQIPIEEEFGWPRSEFSLAIKYRTLLGDLGRQYSVPSQKRLGIARPLFWVLYSMRLAWY